MCEPEFQGYTAAPFNFSCQKSGNGPRQPGLTLLAGTLFALPCSSSKRFASYVASYAASKSSDADSDERFILGSELHQM